jgi:small subunit ribosomal protein S20
VATHKSALKANRQNVVRRERNRQFRTRLRRALKSIRAALEQEDTAKAKDAVGKTVSLIDKMAGRGILHSNAAARYKSRLARRLSRRSATA